MSRSCRRTGLSSAPGAAALARSCRLSTAARRPGFWLALATVLTVLLLAGSTAAAPLIVPNLPNLYQHQKSPDSIDATSAAKPAVVPSYTDLTLWWEPDGGWCCLAAVADLLYALQKNRFPTRGGLFFDQPGHSWVEYMNYGIEKLEVDYFERELTFSRILRERGFADIRYLELYLDGDKVIQSSAPTILCGGCPLFPGDETTFRSLFEAYDFYFRRGAYIALVMTVDPSLIPPEEQDRRGLWWTSSFHVVAGAGLDGNLIYIADPDENRTGQNPGHGWDHRYVANLLEEGETDILLPVDLEPVGLANYARYRFAGNFFETVDERDFVFDDVKIVRLIVLTASGPRAALLLAAGFALFVVRSRVGRRWIERLRPGDHMGKGEPARKVG